MSAMYSKLDKKSVEKAISKAKEVKPLVKVLGFNQFQVAGSKPGEMYCVSFMGRGETFSAVCSCKANASGGKVCYHVAAAANLYKQQVVDRAAPGHVSAVVGKVETELAGDLWFEVCTDCQEAEAVTRDGRCDDCQLIKDANDIY